jgi:tetratricopeptide (TPR) repeat protein
MELVDGRPIDAWCRDRGLDLRGRVALVERVSDALAYAHRHLVVHRDVTPANILVTADAEPKLLDFGIATLLTADGEATGGLTRTGHHSFTPDYASPEQVRGEAVTTASDVYSLGVVLFRLLSGAPPYSLKGLAPLEAMQAVCETEPPSMSAVAPASDAAGLRGDLDRIVAKALRKAPRERYGTVAELAADLRAWQDGRPVSAAAQSVSYRVTRFVRRNRTMVAATAALALALVGGAAATAWQARVAARERDKAQNRFRQVQQFSRALLFDVHDALRPVAGATAARRLLLDRGLRFLDGLSADAGDDVGLQLELSEGYRRLGLVQGSPAVDNLGDRTAALASFDKAATLAEQAIRRDPTAVQPLIAAAEAYAELAAAPDAARAAAAERRHVALLDTLERQHPADVEARAAVAAGHTAAGVRCAGRRDFACAQRHYVASARIFDALPPEVRAARTRLISLTLKRLGAVEMVTGALDDSERHYRAALALEEAEMQKDPADSRWPFETSFTLTDLGVLRRRRGHGEDAVPLWTRALEIRRRALAVDPGNARMIAGVASVVNRLAGADHDAGRYPEAIARLEEVLRLREQLAVITPGEENRGDRAWALYYLALYHADFHDHGGVAGRGHDRLAASYYTRIDAPLLAGAKPVSEFRPGYDALGARLKLAPPRQ